jgi:hypothetical protein
MIAMRVLNNVEREMLKAEWENWLLDENARCKQVQTMLRDDRTTVDKRAQEAESQHVLEVNERDRLDKLWRWHDDYCGSCQLEQDSLLKGKKHLTFG